MMLVVLRPLAKPVKETGAEVDDRLEETLIFV
jgi:hypothetical protein